MARKHLTLFEQPPVRQRAAAKWRVKGLLGNVNSLMDTELFDTQLYPPEQEELRKILYHLDYLISHWSDKSPQDG